MQEYAAREGAPVVAICAALEAEIADMPDEDKQIFLADMNLDEPGLNRLIRAAYQLLGLQTYFTAGVKEVRAWTISKGDTAPQAAAVIHTDFEKGFIRAEVISYDDFIACQRRTGCEGGGQDEAGGQGVRRQGWRCNAFQVQRLSSSRHSFKFRKIVSRTAAAPRSSWWGRS